LTNPSDPAACFDTDTTTNPTTPGNCGFADTVVATGTGLGGLGTLNASPKTANCSLCPINKTCTALTFP
jgi:hypothetical protein